MANSIQLFKKYVTLLDEVYKEAALTSVLDSDATLARDGANTNEIVVPKLSMSGLGNYSRNSGYVSGNVTLNYETVQFNYERGTMFTVDAMDNEETAGIAFGRLASEFIRTQVGPEGDAFRFATYAGTTGIGSKGETLEDGEDVIKALRAATNAMDEAEVPHDERYLFITPTLLGMVEDLQTIDSKEVLKRFSAIIRVPQTRFYTAINLLDGSSEGETSGGYTKAAAGANINFMAVHRPAVMQYNKHIAPKIITPEANQDADAWKFGYRKYGLADVYENKVAGIYCSYDDSTMSA